LSILLVFVPQEPERKSFLVRLLRSRRNASYF
jgi:hypothetical protein